jgi:hypothetical protein
MLGHKESPMSSEANLETLIEAAKELSPEDRKRLARALYHTPRASQQHHITEMRGLGKELWQGIEPQQYINAERDAWEH